VGRRRSGGMCRHVEHLEHEPRQPFQHADLEGFAIETHTPTPAPPRAALPKPQLTSSLASASSSPLCRPCTLSALRLTQPARRRRCGAGRLREPLGQGFSRRNPVMCRNGPSGVHRRSPRVAQQWEAAHGCPIKRPRARHRASRRQTHIMNYIQIGGIILGMLFFGALGDFIGRCWGR
jgi:hypothetical protein